jgi:hypothetical protein
MIALEITRFLDFVHSPASKKKKTRNVSETDPVSETFCSLVSLQYRMMDKVQKPSNSERLRV